MNLGDFKSGLRINIGDANGKIATDATCLSVINRAIIHVWTKLLLCKQYFNSTTISVTITSSSREVSLQLYSATERIQKVLHVETDDGFPVDVLPKEKAIRSTKPCVYVDSRVITVGNDRRQEFYLGWYVIPDASINLIVTIIPKPKQFATGDLDTVINEDIPLEFHPVILNYATYLLLASDEDNAETWRIIYEESASDMLATVGLTNTADQSVVDEYGDDAW